MTLSEFPQKTPEVNPTYIIPKHRVVAVVIPFFQKEAGILRRAMVSVLKQDLPANIRVHVFIVDDSSPLPPEQDLTDLTDISDRDDISWSVHHQLNAGPGAARNRGLDLADTASADFVAFLDSDDEWLPRHLSEAIMALDQGYGFYFCDHTRSDDHEGGHALIAALRDGGAALSPKAMVISTQGPVLGFDARGLAEQMIAEYLCQTSCVVIRTDVTSNHRFDPDLRVAGEDHLYWILIALGETKVAASWRTNVVCGQGLNLYFSAFNWSSPATIDRLGHQLLMTEKLRRMPAAVRCAADTIERKRRMQRRGYAFLFIRGLLKGRRPNIATLRKISRHDPLIWLRLPFVFAKVTLDGAPDSRQW